MGTTAPKPRRSGNRRQNHLHPLQDRPARKRHHVETRQGGTWGLLTHCFEDIDLSIFYCVPYLAALAVHIFTVQERRQVLVDGDNDV